MDTLNDIISGLKWGKLDPVEAHDRVLALFSVSIAKRKLAIKFAEAILNDFEMSTKKDGDTLCWKLCGTPDELTTEELYDRFIDEIYS